MKKKMVCRRWRRKRKGVTIKGHLIPEAGGFYTKILLHMGRIKTFHVHKIHTRLRGVGLFIINTSFIVFDEKYPFNASCSLTFDPFEP